MDDKMEAKSTEMETTHEEETYLYGEDTLVGDHHFSEDSEAFDVNAGIVGESQTQLNNNIVNEDTQGFGDNTKMFDHSLTPRPVNDGAPQNHRNPQTVVKSRLNLRAMGDSTMTQQSQTPPNSPSILRKIEGEGKNSKKRKLEETDMVLLDEATLPVPLKDPVASTPLKALYKRAPCLECDSITLVDSCEVSCNFCERPVCNECSLGAIQLLHTVDKSLLGTSYLYTCKSCKLTLCKGEHLYAAKVSRAAPQSDKLECLDKLATQMEAMTLIMESMDNKYSRLMDAINEKADKTVVNNLAGEINNLKESAVSRDELGLEIRKLRKDISSSTACTDAVDSRIKELREELADVERRKTNLVFFNIKESDAKEPELRKRYDGQMFLKFAQGNLGIAYPPQPRLVTRTPVNKDFQGPRPMKVVFKNEVDKQLCYDRFLELKRSDPDKLRNVGCILDKTKRQSEEQKKARQERKERLEAGEKGPKSLGYRSANKAKYKQPFRNQGGQEPAM